MRGYKRAPPGTGVFRRGPVHMPFGVYVCTRSRQWGSYFDAGASPAGAPSAGAPAAGCELVSTTG